MTVPARLGVCLEAMRLTLKNAPDFSVSDERGQSIVARVYLQALGAYTDEEIERATQEALATLVFFPTPAELGLIIRRHKRDVLEAQQARRALPPAPEKAMAAEDRARLDALFQKFTRVVPGQGLQEVEAGRAPISDAEAREHADRRRTVLKGFENWLRESNGRPQV